MRLIDADALLEKYNKTTVWDSWVEINIAPTIDAVSYTHLDVYKRQDISRSFIFMSDHRAISIFISCRSMIKQSRNSS